MTTDFRCCRPVGRKSLRCYPADVTSLQDLSPGAKNRCSIEFDVCTDEVGKMAADLDIEDLRN
jgi:hypothetical protein